MSKALTTALRAVDYLRVATEEQAEGHGIRYTGGKAVKYIAAKGWTHVNTYADEGLSGSLEAHQRPGAVTGRSGAIQRPGTGGTVFEQNPSGRPRRPVGRGPPADRGAGARRGHCGGAGEPPAGAVRRVRAG